MGYTGLIPLNIFLTMPRIGIYCERPQDVLAFEEVSSVVIVGSSGSGKTRLVNAIRCSELVSSGAVYVPKRYITRPGRKNDDFVENTLVSDIEFERLVFEGIIDLAWERELEAGRKVKYGFEAVSSDSELLVYPGNNALFRERYDVFSEEQLRSTLFVCVYANREIRERRLRERSPDLFESRAEELEKRLNDQQPVDSRFTDYIQEIFYCRSQTEEDVTHLRIFNDDAFRYVSEISFLKLLQGIVNIKRGRIVGSSLRVIGNERSGFLDLDSLVSSS